LTFGRSNTITIDKHGGHTEDSLTDHFTSLIDKMLKFLNSAQNSPCIHTKTDDINNHLSKVLLNFDIEKLKSKALELRGLTVQKKNKANTTNGSNYHDPEVREVIANSNKRLSAYKMLFDSCMNTLDEVRDILKQRREVPKSNTSSIIDTNVNVNKKCTLPKKGKLAQSIVSNEGNVTGCDFTRSIHIPTSLIKQVNKQTETMIRFGSLHESDNTLPISYQVFPKTRSKSVFNSFRHVDIV
jgi:hypothetical protein